MLRQHDVPPADAIANVDVEPLLAELTAELAEAHRQTQRRLEADRQALASERDELVAACRELNPKPPRSGARAAAEERLKRAEVRSTVLQHQLQVVWARSSSGRSPRLHRSPGGAGSVRDRNPRERSAT
jgi:hypothetical protein